MSWLVAPLADAQCVGIDPEGDPAFREPHAGGNQEAMIERKEFYRHHFSFPQQKAVDSIIV
jgi:hypothetical protein